MKNRFKKGFTLVELSIAIAFVSILLIIVALVTDDVIGTYRKGVAMKSINTVGLDLIDDFTNAISQSPATNVENLCSRYKVLEGTTEAERSYNACVADDGNNFIYQTYRYEIKIKEKDTAETLPAFGTFCTGKYSYIWNTGYALGSESYALNDSGNVVPKAKLTVKNGGSVIYSSSDFRLLKVSDTSRSVCASRIGESYEYQGGTASEVEFEITGTSQPEELLTHTSDKSGLALYDLSVFPPAQDPATNHLYYSASIILGTMSDSVNIAASSDRCLTPENFKSDYNYCAINKLNFAMRATGGS